jgi:hypothetical protein
MMKCNLVRELVLAAALLALPLELAPVCAGAAAANADVARDVARNLLVNGDFTHGSGDSVDGWRIDAWILTPGTTDYSRIPAQDGQPAELKVFTHRDNDARWAQPLSLGPGWYYISAEARTEDVLTFMVGANVSVLEDGIKSEDLKGTRGWQRLGLYLKIPARGADIDVALRLGGYMNLSRGAAFFRNASVIKVAAPPAGAPYVYDLGEIRKNETTGPIGSTWTLVATFFLFIAVAAIGWRMLGETQAAAVRAELKRDNAPRKRLAR